MPSRFNRFACFLRERRVDLINVFGFGDHLFHDQVEQPEEAFRGRSVVLEVDLTGVNGVVPNDPHHIEGLLNEVEAAGDKGFDVVVDVLARLTEVLAQFLMPRRMRVAPLGDWPVSSPASS
ncbi:MAG: hypothetical protein M9957_05535 [Rhodobacteraceae bacterium]|nr:hypothetical protein [Paracoccaceae bacterium]